MNEKEQYEIYKDLMFRALAEPNDINFICTQVICSLAVLGQKSTEEFRGFLEDVGNMFEQMGTLNEYMQKALDDFLEGNGD